MTEFRCLVWCFFSTLVLGSVGVAQEAEPTYKGRTFEEWRRLMTNDLDADTRADAYRAVNLFSIRNPDAYLKSAQQLIETHLPQEKSSKVLEVGYRCHSKWTPADRLAFWKKALQSDSPAHRVAAASAMGAFQAIPTEAATQELAEFVMEIIKTENDRRIRTDAMGALRSIVDSSEYDYDWSANPPTSRKILPEGEYGPITKKAIPLTEKLLNDPDATICEHALYLALGLPPEVAVKQLADRLVALAKVGKLDRRSGKGRITDEERLAKSILDKLKRYGAKAKPVVPILEQVRRDLPGRDNDVGRSIDSTIDSINAAES